MLGYLFFYILHYFSKFNFIGADQQEFDLSNFDYGFGTYSIASTAPDQLVDVAIARPTSSTDVDDDIYWGIGIPSGKPSGDYYGENTFTVIQDNTASNWN